MNSTSAICSRWADVGREGPRCLRAEGDEEVRRGAVSLAERAQVDAQRVWPRRLQPAHRHRRRPAIALAIAPAVAPAIAPAIAPGRGLAHGVCLPPHLRHRGRLAHGVCLPSAAAPMAAAPKLAEGITRLPARFRAAPGGGGCHGEQQQWRRASHQLARGGR
eukprot:2249252-Prymnesium_polylepis.1